jgi:glycine/D-amino acid oxidase-like deaminating enzyme
MLRAIRNICTKNKVDMSYGEIVIAINYEQDTDTYKVTTNKSTYHCKKLVLAAGAGSAPIGQLLGITIPIVPVRGTMWSTHILT